MLAASSSSVPASLHAQEARLLRRAVWMAVLLHVFGLSLFFASQLWQQNQKPTESEPPSPLAIPIPLAIEIPSPPPAIPELDLSPELPAIPQTREAGQATETPVESFIESSRNARAGTMNAELQADLERIALDGSQDQAANALDSQLTPGEQTPSSSTDLASLDSQDGTLSQSPQSSVQLPESDLLASTALRRNPETLPQDQAAQQQLERLTQRMTGQLRSDGSAQFDTEATPLGAYMERVGEAVAASWQDAVAQRQGNSGTLRLRFRIRPSGESTNFEFIGLREAGSVAEDITLEAVIQAELPPIPAEVLEELETRWLECEYDFLFL